MNAHVLLSSVAFLLAVVSVPAGATTCAARVVEDRNADGKAGPRERGIGGVRVSNGIDVVTSDAAGRFAIDTAPTRSVFVIKPAGYRLATRADGLPAHWHAPGACSSFALIPDRRRGDLDVLVFADPQPKSRVDVGYYLRDIVEPTLAADARDAELGITLGDVVDDDLSLYPPMVAATTRLGVPWLHVAGNHDVDAAVSDDDAALRTFHRHFGPDTFAWEEREADFVLMDDVVSTPGQRPAYVGGLRGEQFAFLRNYLATRDARRLLVLAVHIPLFPDGAETFRAADRERLFAMLEDVPKVLVLSGHGHVQRHVFHDATTGWHGAEPLHEYNVGAASGAYWSGAKDAAGVPDSTMPDGTPNGTARLRVDARGGYRLAWVPARLVASDALTAAMRLHAPRVLRRGAYPAWGVYANVWMGTPGTRVEFRVDGGEWKRMKRVEQPDPWLLAENTRDDASDSLRGYDRSPEAQPSTHLWRAALPTSLQAGTHRVEVRAFDPWQGEQRAVTRYRLDETSP